MSENKTRVCPFCSETTLTADQATGDTGLAKASSLLDRAAELVPDENTEAFEALRPVREQFQVWVDEEAERRFA